MKTLAKLKRRLQRMFGLRHQLRSDFCGQRKALIVHGLHKSASMFLYKFFEHVCGAIDVPFHSINLAQPLHRAPDQNTAESFVVCPERSFETHEFYFPKLEQIHLFQVRDPRDILVSEYYSLGWRHSDQDWGADGLKRRAQIQQLSIDQYVIGETEVSKRPLLLRYQPLLAELGRPTTHVVKYETMVEDFPRWLSTVLPVLGLNSGDDLAFLASHYRDEFQPDLSENSHKRNVSAGDHVSKLKPETIAILNERFASILKALDYES